MKIPRYWAKETYPVQDASGKTIPISCWRWSDSSLADARQQAQLCVKRATAQLQTNKRPKRYAYGERPLREEIIEAIRNGKNQEIAIVTRNSYGALVLNTANVMFIDIDFPKSGWLTSLLRKLRRRLGNPVLTPEEVHLQRFEEWVRQHPELGIRVYRTFGGLRGLITSECFDPTEENSLDILRALNSDPLYINLCRSQESFRARLTPKPWRCGSARPPSRYPWENPEEERNYRQWENEYNVAAHNYTVCRFLTQVGDGKTHPEAQIVLSLHDQHACSEYPLKLA